MRINQITKRKNTEIKVRHSIVTQTKILFLCDVLFWFRYCFLFFLLFFLLFESLAFFSFFANKQLHCVLLSYIHSTIAIVILEIFVFSTLFLTSFISFSLFFFYFFFVQCYVSHHPVIVAGRFVFSSVCLVCTW